VVYVNPPTRLLQLHYRCTMIIVDHTNPPSRKSLLRQAGGIASRIVVDTLPQMIEYRMASLRSPLNRIVELILREAILKLSQKFQAKSKRQMELQGIGATLR
jgi:hypothetical protein